MSREFEWHELIDRHLHGELNEAEKERLAEWLDSDVSARKAFVEQVQWDTQFSEVLREREGALRGPMAQQIADLLSAEQTATRQEHSSVRLLTKTLLAVAAAVVILLCVNGVFWILKGESEIARLTKLDGYVQWTGTGGQVERLLEEGQALTGGTLEIMAPDAWATLTFTDGSSVTLLGQSTLTIAEQAQKVLHLSQGHLAAQVKAQAPGKPLLIRTEAAELEVLGTHFNVTANAQQTKLVVNEGRVRLKQHADVQEVEVSASQQVVASIEAEQALAVTSTRTSINAWIANLARDVEHGEWMSVWHAARLEVGNAVRKGEISMEEAGEKYETLVANVSEDEGSVHARPKRDRNGNGVSYLVTLCASRGLPGPVALAEGGIFRIQGKVQSPTVITFGFSTLDMADVSAHRYWMRQPLDREGKFDLELPLTGFQSRTARPWGKQLVNLVCLTTDRRAALEISRVELLASE
ncbi:MAG: FecR domain-containing protein [Planctomycetes bacterium]|nr:FecR domain-containing protein [Planctomycetota bacterium]